MDNINKIPKDFYSFDTGEPFKSCLMCNRDLLVDGQIYVIERSIKTYPGTTAMDVLYEYAMCIDCALKQKETISEESLRNIENYFRFNLSLDQLSKSYDHESKAKHCIVHGTSTDQMSEYVIQATCNGNNLDSTVQPMIFGDQAISEMEELISVATRDEMDDFIDQHFGGPPEWREILRKRTLLI